MVTALNKALADNSAKREQMGQTNVETMKEFDKEKVNEIAKQAELNHVTEFIGGVKEAECSELISSYFKNKRN